MAIIRINFNKFEYLNFKLISSGEDKKSIKTAGIIKEYGLPFTNTTTLPSKIWLTALSGLSVAIICGNRARLLS